MKTTKFISPIIGVAALAMVFIASCKKDQERMTSPSSYSAAPTTVSSTLSRTQNECGSCCVSTATATSFYGQEVAMSDVGDPEYWNTPYYFNICSASAGTSPGTAQFKLESYFNSYASGVNGWNVWYLPTTFNYANSIDTVGCTWAKANASNSNICVPPNWTVTTGAIGMVTGNCAGWYTYNSTTRLITPIRALVVWKDCANPTNTTNISTATDVYVIYMTITGTVVGGNYSPYITVNYKSVCCS